MRHLNPSLNSGSYVLMKALHEHGAMTATELAATPAFVGVASKVSLILQTWIERGWVTFGEDKFALTTVGRKFFGGVEEVPPYVGQVATSSQINLMTRPPYKSPRRVVRADVPVWSVRAEGFGFKALSGAVAP